MNGVGDWSLVGPARTCRRSDRLTGPLTSSCTAPTGRDHGSTTCAATRFVALYFADARRRPAVPSNDSPALAHYAVSRWDAPHDSGLRDRALLDPGDRLFRRLKVPAGSVVLVRPDEHVAAIAPITPGIGAALYERAVGRPPPE